MLGRFLTRAGRPSLWGRPFTSSSTYKPYTAPLGPWGANRGARLELAAAYRGLDLLGLNEGVSNHLTAVAPRADGEGSVMLVFPEGQGWREVQASSLLGLDMEGVTVEGEGSPETTASVIHLAMHKSRPDIRVVMHTHQPYATALGCLEEAYKLRPVHQNHLRFYERVAYDVEYGGVSYEEDEGKRLAQVLGDKDILMMGNHGVLAVSATIAGAFMNLYFLERAAMVQMLAMSTREKLREIPEAIPKAMFAEYKKREQKYADDFFYSVYRQLQKSEPQFET